MRRCLTLGLTLLAACSADLPDVEDVRDFRVLAIRTDPPEIFVDVDDGVQVQFSALVVDPRQPPIGASPVDFTWSFCPVETDQACLDYDRLRAQASSDDQALLDRLSTITMSGSAVEEPEARGLTADQAAFRAMWPYAITPYDLVLSEADSVALAAYFVRFNGLGLGQGSLPSIVLDTNAIDDTIRSEKRFTLAVQDPAKAAAQFGVDLGYTVCASDESPDDGCVPFRPQDRNSNPTFHHMEYSPGEFAGQTFSAAPQPFSMHRGDSIRLLPVLTNDSYETYQELFTDAATGKIGVREQAEQISISWFASAGDLQDDLTSELDTRTLDTKFTAASNIPAEGKLVSVFMVARDQRGGVAWTNFEIDVTP